MKRIRRAGILAALILCLYAASVGATDQDAWNHDDGTSGLLTQIDQGARWTLTSLGVTDEARLGRLRRLASRQAVSLAIVGQGGVSKKVLGELLSQGNSLEYRMGPNFPNCDPEKSTHDTGMARVILGLTSALGIHVDVLVYQPGEEFSSVAEAFAQAGHEADIVAFFQSFWGNEVALMVDSIAQANGALFIGPYGEVGSRHTSTSLQAHAAKPWQSENGGIPHLVTAAPLARKSDGSLLKPLDRGAVDTETINFVAPSYYASGPGGTCLGAVVTTAVAAYIYAARETKPDPLTVLNLLRQTANVDRELLTMAPEFNDETIDRLQQHIDSLVNPTPPKSRKLDTPGVLNLYALYSRMQAQARRPAQIMIALPDW